MKKLLITPLLLLSLNSISQVIFQENFESGLGNWTVYDNDADGFTWELGSETGLSNSGSYYARVRYNSTGNDDYLFSPNFNIPINNLLSTKLTFYVKSQDPSYLENMEIYYSDGITDYYLGAIPAVPSTYTLYNVNLDQFKGSTGYLTFRCVSLDKYYLLLDDIKIESFSTASIQEENQIFAQIYPNPFTDLVTLNNIEVGSTINVTTIDGKLIYSSNLQTDKIEINTNNWLSGSYIFILQTNDKTQTFKLIK
jgi:hypothetical protein